MFDQSVIRKSGQWWKLVLSFVTLSAGGFLMYYSVSHDVQLIPMAGGMLLGLFGFVFGCVAIRCPDCGARWVWMGVSGQSHSKWLAWLLSQSECSVCKGNPD